MKVKQATLFDWETRLTKNFVVFFLLLHLIFLVFDLTIFQHEQVLEEWDMGIELVDDGKSSPSPTDAIKDHKTAPEVAVDERILPQLPKKFTIDEPPPPAKEEEAIDSEAAKKPEAKPIQDQDKKTELAKADEEKVERIKQDALAKLLKDDAIKRLLKEKARLEEKKSKENQSPLNENLTKRLQDLAKSAESPPGLLGESTYGQNLKRKIAKFYSLPEIYNLRGAPIKATVQMVLDPQGEVVEAKLAQSSKDEVFDQLALRTIKSASPFPRPPVDWVGKVITVPFEPVKR